MPKNCAPGAANSILIKTEKDNPIIPAKIAYTKYNVPISLALVLYIQRAKVI